MEDRQVESKKMSTRKNERASEREQYPNIEDKKRDQQNQLLV